MKKLITDSRGVTLVEVLAAITIASIILVLIANVQLFGQKEFVNENKQLSHQADVRLVLKMMTQDIRKANAAEVTGNGRTLKAGTAITYQSKEDGIYRDGKLLVENASFHVAKLSDGVEILVQTAKDARGEKVEVSTIINTRVGD